MLYRWIHPQFLRKCITSFCFSMKPGTCVRLWYIGPWNYLCLVKFLDLGFHAKSTFHCKSALSQTVIPITAAHLGITSFTSIQNCLVLYKDLRAAYTKTKGQRTFCYLTILYVYIYMYFHPYMQLKTSHFEQTNSSSIERYVMCWGGCVMQTAELKVLFFSHK